MATVPALGRADPITEASERVRAEAAAEPAPGTPGAPASARPKLEVAFTGGVALSAAFVDWRRPTPSGARDGDLRFSMLDLVRVYFDSGQLRKSNDNFQTSRQLVVGSYLLAGPLHFSLDLGFGKHHPWIGPDYGSALGAGSSSAGWHRWINVNLGFAY